MLAILTLLGLSVSAFVVTTDGSDGGGEPDQVEDERDLRLVRFGGDGGDLLLGQDANDHFDGRDGNDILSGGKGADELHGGRDSDLLLGGDDADDLNGHVGHDVIHGGRDDDVIRGGDGDDHINGGAGGDSLSGNLGDDTLYGGFGRDVLFGGAGNDHLDGTDDVKGEYLNGGAGDDRLIGTGDVMSGGTGADTFVIANGTQIMDFDPAQDIIEIPHHGDAPDLTWERQNGGLALLADGTVTAFLHGVTDPPVEAIRLIHV